MFCQARDSQLFEAIPLLVLLLHKWNQNYRQKVKFALKKLLSYLPSYCIKLLLRTYLPLHLTYLTFLLAIQQIVIISNPFPLSSNVALPVHCITSRVSIVWQVSEKDRKTPQYVKSKMANIPIERTDWVRSVRIKGECWKVKRWKIDGRKTRRLY